MSSCRRSAVPTTKPRMGLGFHRLASRLRETEDGEAPKPWRRAVALGVARERVAGQRSGHEAARRNETGWSVSINGGALDYSPWEPAHRFDYFWQRYSHTPKHQKQPTLK
jgi:hypothetical protein